VRYPWREDRTGRESRAGAAYYLTDIREHEIIAGSNEALEGALSQVHANHPDDAVIVAVACSPVVSGEDWAGTVKRFRQVHKAPVMATAIAGDDLILEIARVGREVLDSAKAQDCEVRHDEGRAAGKADSRAADRRNAAAGGRPSDAAAQGRVHLVGFPRTRGTEELCGLLRACGVQVVQRQVPDVSLRRLSGYSGEASAQLLWPQAEYEPLYEALFLRASVPAVRVPAPFGLSGTRAFLDAAVRAAGLHVPHAVARIEAQLETAGRDLAVLAQRAAAVRLGVAVTPHFTSVPDSPELACGVPLIAFLRELGFQVEILHDAQDPARLDWWLRSRLSAVFTELSFDSRLSAAGVAPFGLPDLEPGVAGAIRTARRLLRLADMRFFRHLAPYRCEEGGQ